MTTYPQGHAGYPQGQRDTQGQGLDLRADLQERTHAEINSPRARAGARLHDRARARDVLVLLPLTWGQDPFGEAEENAAKRGDLWGFRAREFARHWSRLPMRVRRQAWLGGVILLLNVAVTAVLIHQHIRVV